MANSKHNDAITIREIEFSILIKDKDKGFHELGDILRSELTRFEDRHKDNTVGENPIHDFLKTNIDRSIVIRESTKVYFLNYREHGSFSIQFTLLILTRYINYGSTRQALDYLIKDTIGNYFEELLERHLPVNVSVHSVDKELYEIPGDQDINFSKRRPSRDMLPVILATLAILISLTLGLTWYFQGNDSKGAIRPSGNYQDKYLELLIDKQINEAMEKGKSNSMDYTKQESVSDSGENVRIEEKK
jgi:hypothetical protein